MSDEDFNFICTPPPKEAERHHKKLEAVYKGSFQAALAVWNRLPQTQWETTRAIARDLPEWKDLVAVLIVFRKQLKTVRRIPKPKGDSNAQSESPKVSE